MSDDCDAETWEEKCTRSNAAFDRIRRAACGILEAERATEKPTDPYAQLAAICVVAAEIAIGMSDCDAADISAMEFGHYMAREMPKYLKSYRSEVSARSHMQLSELNKTGGPKFRSVMEVLGIPTGTEATL